MSKITNLNGEELKIEDRTPEDINFIPHPKRIFVVKADREKTKGGVILPEGDQKTPIAKILKVGETLQDHYSEGEFVYVNPVYGEAAEIDGVVGMMLYGDAIFGKIPNKEEDE